MNDSTIKALAAYFTGHAVAFHSVHLELPSSKMHETARRFFAAREALGITGYPTKQEAIEVIKEKV